MLKLCCALKFFAHGSYEQTVGKDFQLGLAQPTVSLTLKEMLPIMEAKLCNALIKTHMTEAEKQQARRKFYTQTGIPNVIGCIDGTHIGIIAPNDCKYLTSMCINCILACDHDMLIRFVDAPYAGSTHHDSFVWNSSSLKRYLENTYKRGAKNSAYLGDSRYPLHEYLLTLFRTALPGTIQATFNKKHSKARNVVERTIDALKCRFRSG
ncbi:PREDICTED: putative nuclease HARBI1 [Rhagoletis zephyria]|uniref:putative nuclease HARBI1 n=1 Tax=Rhagoletis zephyria TaxID=28612 RepID=UPI000811265C|nr:PREDICTED: putative nuclease HARBI1 [Rhagoletis zephyria]